MKRLLLLLVSGLPFYVSAQTINDGLMMPSKTICTGFVYMHDQWTNYWEGELKRDNENIGKVTTQSLAWMANYGVTKKLNVIAMLPYISTKASAGTLSGMEGVQDLTLALKYNFFKKETTNAKIKGFGSLSYSRPMAKYSPDFLPLSIGLASQTLSYRLTGHYQFVQGFYFTGSAAYTWRSNVELDRPSYYTNGNIFQSSEVKMPNVFDWVVNMGYHKGPFQADLNYTEQETLSGGDIRRQDMPFVSNKMNFAKVGGFVMYYVAAPKGLAVRAGVATTTAGRNVGQSTTYMGGLLYTIQFSKKAE